MVSPKKSTILDIFDEKLVDFETRFAGQEGRLLRLPGAPIYVGMQNYVGMLRNWISFNTSTSLNIIDLRPITCYTNPQHLRRCEQSVGTK